MFAARAGGRWRRCGLPAFLRRDAVREGASRRAGRVTAPVALALDPAVVLALGPSVVRALDPEQPAKRRTSPRATVAPAVVPHARGCRRSIIGAKLAAAPASGARRPARPIAGSGRGA